MNKHHDLPIKLMIYPAMIFLVIGMIIGLFMAFFTFIFPDYFAGEYIHFGRIRPTHIWNVLFLWLLSANIGLVYFMVPRLCGVPLWSPKIAYVSIALWWSSLIITTFAFPTGINTGWEYSEIPHFVSWMPVKIMALVAWLLVVLNVFMTVATRKFEKMYVSLWYVMGTMMWASFTLFVGWYVVNWVAQGMSRVNTSFFYIHNLVGMIFTPLGLSAAYYFLPKTANTPIYSHNLSMLGFWALAFVYAWVGAHHIIHGPVSQWLQTTSIIFSMWLFIPVWAFVTNIFATLKNKWELYSQDAGIRFIIMGTVFYLLTCVQGPLMALRNVNEITSKTDWIIGHSHVSLYATFSFYAFAGIYFVVPVITQKPLWSKRLADWHFTLNLWGSFPFILAIWIGGFLQGLMWASWTEGSSYAQFHNNLSNFTFIDTIVEMRPWWILRAIGGLMIFCANILFVWNMYNTILLAPERELLEKNSQNASAM